MDFNLGLWLLGATQPVKTCIHVNVVKTLRNMKCHKKGHIRLFESGYVREQPSVSFINHRP